MTRWLTRLNILAVAAGGLMAASFKYPWWSVALGPASGSARADVYPYVIRGGITEILGYTRNAMMPYLTGVLAAGLVLCLVASPIRGRIGRTMLAVVGVLDLLVAGLFLRRIILVARRFGVPLQGHGIGRELIQPLVMDTRFGWGYCLIIAAGVLCLLASALHRWLCRPEVRNG